MLDFQIVYDILYDGILLQWEQMCEHKSQWVAMSCVGPVDAFWAELQSIEQGYGRLLGQYSAFLRGLPGGAWALTALTLRLFSYSFAHDLPAVWARADVLLQYWWRFFGLPKR